MGCPRLALASLLLVLGASCAQAEGSAPEGGMRDASPLHDATGASDGTLPDGGAPPPPPDSAPLDGGPPPPPPPPPDAGPVDAGHLDPGLALPDPSGDRCTTPGSLSECASTAEVCRFYTPAEGRCESCVSCGNLGASCGASDECDILFMCFLGRCTNFCELGTFECGRVEECLDVGHPRYGVCLP